MMALGNSTSAMTRHLLPLGMVLLGALVLCLPAIWNGFPLVYSDTGAYLATAFEGKVPLARPTGYGLFVRYTAVGGQLWLTLLAQGLLMAGLLWRTVRVTLPNADARRVYPVAYGVAVGLTGVAWYAGQLMPDILTGLVALAFFLILFDRQAKWWGRLIYAFLAYWFCFAHYSHMALLLGLAGFAACAWGWQALRKRPKAFSGGRIGMAALPAVMALLSFYYVNHAHGYGWRMTRSAHVFTMARLSETGMLRDYLHETCAEQHWSLCPYADSLPATAAAFIWNDDSPFKKTGYWENSKPGYDSLLADFFNRGKYRIAYGKAAMKSGFAQLFELSVGEGVTPYNENSSPYKFFERAMPSKIPAYVASKQFERVFSFGWEKWLLWITMVVASVLLLGVGIVQRRQWTRPLRWFAVIAVLSYVANAVLTGALANVYARLQARIAWLIPLACCLLLLAWWQKYKGSRS
jgi:hypothetical protein